MQLQVSRTLGVDTPERTLVFAVQIDGEADVSQIGLYDLRGGSTIAANLIIQANCCAFCSGLLDQGACGFDITRVKIGVAMPRQAGGNNSGRTFAMPTGCGSNYGIHIDRQLNGLAHLRIGELRR